MQTEKPAPSLEQLEATLGVKVFYASGGMIENFREGWAVNAMSSGTSAHYFKRNRHDYAISLCGQRVAARWIYGAGNFPECRSCKKINGKR